MENLKVRVRHLVEDYAEILPANPRLIRRVANTWGMLRTIRAPSMCTRSPSSCATRRFTASRDPLVST